MQVGGVMGWWGTAWGNGMLGRGGGVGGAVHRRPDDELGMKATMYGRRMKEEGCRREMKTEGKDDDNDDEGWWGTVWGGVMQ